MKKHDVVIIVLGVILFCFIGFKKKYVYNKLINDPTFTVGKVIGVSVNRTDYIDYEFQTNSGLTKCGSILAKRNKVKKHFKYLVVYDSDNHSYNYLDYNIPLNDKNLGDELKIEKYKNEININRNRLLFRWIPFGKSRCNTY